MIYECTDCRHCASFSCGFRVICLHDDLDPAEVCNYFPVGEGDAGDCVHFEEDFPAAFSWSDLTTAEQYSEEKYGEVTYQGIKEWCQEQERKNLEASKAACREE